MLLVLGAAALDAAPLEGFKRVAESQHFVHFARGNAQTDVAKREACVARFQRILDVHFDRRVEYYAYERAEDLEQMTGGYLAGLFLPTLDQVHATPEAEAHEIVHLLSNELGDPGSFFNEGLAVVLGNGDRFGGWPVDRVARDLLKKHSPVFLASEFGQFRSSWEAEAAAGSFVKWLGKRHGVPKIASFFRACGRAGQPVAFEATFGQPLAEALHDWTRAVGATPLPLDPQVKLAQAWATSALSQPAR